MAAGATHTVVTAAGVGDLDALKELVEADPPTLPDDWQGIANPLIWAARGGQPEVVAYLLALGVDPDSTWTMGISPLHLAAEQDRVAVIEVLAAAGADVNARSGQLPDKTPLHEAARRDHAASVRALLECGANAALKDRDGQTPLQVARRSTRSEAARILKEHAARSKAGGDGLPVPGQKGGAR